MALEHITRDIWWGDLSGADRAYWTDQVARAGFKTDRMKSIVVDDGKFVGGIKYVTDEDNQIVVDGNEPMMEYVGDVEAMEKFLGPNP